MGQGFDARLTASFSILLALVGVIHAATTFRQDILFTRAETELGFWGREDYHPTPVTIQRTEQQLNSLLQRAPEAPQNLTLLANYAAWRGYWAEDLREGQQFNSQAANAQYAALESRPAHRHSWAKMLQYSSRIQDGKSIRAVAQSRLQALQPSVGPD